jgi:hypothetical protein
MQAFSPLTTVRSAPNSRRSGGRPASSAYRPAFPTASPRNNSFISSSHLQKRTAGKNNGERKFRSPQKIGFYFA